MRMRGLITAEEFEARLKALQPPARRVEPVRITNETLRAYLDVFDSDWGSWTAEEKRSLLLAVAPRIDIAWLDNDLRLTVYSPLAEEPISREFTTQRSRHKK